MSERVPIGSIRVGDRHRKSLGDLLGLMESIQRSGLLNPITVTPDLELIAGGRRLEACRRMGWEEVPIHVVDSLDSALDRLLAERDENDCRESMIVEDWVALGKSIEALEKPKAAERMKAGTRPCDTGSQGSSEPRVREKVGAAIGVSGITYARAKTVVETANDPELPEEVRATAQEALKEMNESGNVKGAFIKTLNARDKPDPKPPETKRDQILATSHLKRAHKLAAQVAGLAEGADVLDVDRIRGLAPDQAEAIAAELGRSLTKLRKFRKALNPGGSA